MIFKFHGQNSDCRNKPDNSAGNEYLLLIVALCSGVSIYIVQMCSFVKNTVFIFVYTCMSFQTNLILCSKTYTNVSLIENKMGFILKIKQPGRPLVLFNLPNRITVNMDISCKLLKWNIFNPILSKALHYRIFILVFCKT